MDPVGNMKNRQLTYRELVKYGPETNTTYDTLYRLRLLRAVGSPKIIDSILCYYKYLYVI